jgi:hypothetical protein
VDTLECLRTIRVFPLYGDAVVIALRHNYGVGIHAHVAVRYRDRAANAAKGVNLQPTMFKPRTGKSIAVTWRRVNRGVM